MLREACSAESAESRHRDLPAGRGYNIESRSCAGFFSPNFITPHVISKTLRSPRNLTCLPRVVSARPPHSLTRAHLRTRPRSSRSEHNSSQNRYLASPCSHPALHKETNSVGTFISFRAGLSREGARAVRGRPRGCGRRGARRARDGPARTIGERGAFQGGVLPQRFAGEHVGAVLFLSLPKPLVGSVFLYLLMTGQPRASFVLSVSFACWDDGCFRFLFFRLVFRVPCFPAAWGLCRVERTPPPSLLLGCLNRVYCAAQQNHGFFYVGSPALGEKLDRSPPPLQQIS